MFCSHGNIVSIITPNVWNLSYIKFQLHWLQFTLVSEAKPNGKRLDFWFIMNEQIVLDPILLLHATLTVSFCQ